MEQKKEQPGLCGGLVTEATGSTYTVVADDGRVFRSRTCPGTKTENEETSLVAVGDRVELRGAEQFDTVITLVKHRRSALTRKRDIRRNRSKEKIQVIAANIDQLVVVVSAVDPPLSTRLVDRYLVFAESEMLDVLIVVNKMDLADSSFVAEQMAPYHRLGYSVFYTTVEDPDSLLPLMSALPGNLSAFSGHSGVGKSTLINLLFGQKQLRTRRTNIKTGKGVHTTSNSVMLPLPGGGYVIDTPGIREFNISDITRENLRFYFREFLAFMPDCAFSSCLHTEEPECAVQRAVHAGGIDPARYESYLAIFYSLE